MLHRIILSIHFLLFLIGAANAQEQVSFFEHSRSNGMEYSYYYEVDAEYRIVVRHVNGDVNILNLKEDRSIDTLFTANYTADSQAYTKTAYEKYYYEVYAEKIVRINIETLEEEILSGNPILSNRNTKGTIAGLSLLHNDQTSYILNSENEVKTIDRILTASNERKLQNNFGLHSKKDDNGDRVLELLDFNSGNISTIDIFPTLSFLPSSPHGVTLSTDDFVSISYYDETLQEVNGFYDLPQGNELKYADWSDNYLFVSSVQDSMETIAVFNAALDMVGDFIFHEPDEFARYITSAVFVSSDSLLINYAGRTLALAKNGDQTLELLKENIGSNQIMSNDSVVAFIQSAVLYQLDFSTMEIFARDSIDYANRTSFGSGYHNNKDYILTDEIFFTRVNDELYVSKGIQEVVHPMWLAEGNIIFSGLRDHTDLFRACGQPSIVFGDSLLACFNGSEMVRVNQHRLFRNNVVSMDGDTYYVVWDENFDRKFIHLTFDGSDFIETTRDDLSSIWQFGKSANDNYLIFIDGENKVYIRKKGDPTIRLVDTLPESLNLENEYYGNTVLLEKNGNPDSLFSYNIDDKSLQNIGATFYTDYGHQGEGGILMTSDGDDRSYFRFDKPTEKFVPIDFGMPTGYYTANLRPCGQKYLGLMYTPGFDAYYNILDPELETSTQLTSPDKFHTSILTLDEDLFFTTTNDDNTTEIRRINCQEETFDVMHSGDNDILVNLFNVNESRFGHFFNYDTRLASLASIDDNFNYQNIATYPSPTITQSLYLGPLVSAYESAPMVIEDLAIVNMNPDNLGNELYQVNEDGTYQILFDLFEGPLSSEILTLRMDGKKNMLYDDGYIFFTGRTYENGRQVYRFQQENVISTDVAEVVLVQNNLKLFPNPSSDKLNITEEGQKLSDHLFTVTNMNGQILITGNLSNGSLDISTLPNGIYSLQIKVKNEVFALKFVMQK